MAHRESGGPLKIYKPQFIDKIEKEVAYAR